MMQSKTQLEHKIDICNKLYDFIEAFIDQNGYAPSLREMGAAMDKNSTSIMRGYVRTLESWKWAKVESGKSRALVLLPKTDIQIETKVIKISKWNVTTKKKPGERKRLIRQQIQPYGGEPAK